MSFDDLMAGPPPTQLPADPADAELAGGADPGDVVRRHPASPAAWAAVAQQARDADADDLTVYAYARVGYHRSLDMLRRNGWKGHGPVPWEHEPNRGFLRSLALLALSARAIGEDDEWERCSTFLRDSSPAAADELLGRSRGLASSSDVRTPHRSPSAITSVGSRGPRSASTSRR